MRPRVIINCAFITSYERDSETGLDFAQARYFSSVNGRFQSPDPLASSATTADPQSWNRYAYVGNNPTTSVDPSGMVGVRVAQGGDLVNLGFRNKDFGVYGGLDMGSWRIDTRSAWDRLTTEEQNLISQKMELQMTGSGKNARLETPKEAFNRILKEGGVSGLDAAENVVASVRNMLDVTEARYNGPIWGQINKIVKVWGTIGISFGFTVYDSQIFQAVLKGRGYVVNMKVLGFDENTFNKKGNHRYSIRYLTESADAVVPHWVQQNNYESSRYDLHFDPANSACTKCTYAEQANAGLLHNTKHLSAIQVRLILQKQARNKMTKLPITEP